MFPSSVKYVSRRYAWTNGFRRFCKGALTLEEMPFVISDEDAEEYALLEHGVAIPVQYWGARNLTIDLGEFMFLKTPLLTPPPLGSRPPIAPTIDPGYMTPPKDEKLILKLPSSIRAKRERDEELILRIPRKRLNL
jgi:hypothetical protein